MKNRSHAFSASFMTICHYVLLLMLTGPSSMISVSAKENVTIPNVKVTVYYESLCHDSRNFILNQLYPTWKDLSNIMTVDLNAFGKAQETKNNGIFTYNCQHGTEECQRNELLTCAKKYVKDINDYIHFASCIMKPVTASTDGLICANEIGADYSAIETCILSQEGNRLIHEVSQKQSKLDPPLDYVPWILIDDVYTLSMHRESEKNLRKVICNAYQGPSPSGCQ